MIELVKQLRCGTGGLSMIEIDALMSEAAAALEPLTREPDADEVELVARAIYEVMPHYDLDQGFAVMSWDDLVAFEEGAGYTPTITVLRDKARAAIAALPRRDAMREALQGLLNAEADFEDAQQSGNPGQRYASYARLKEARETARAALTEEPGHGA